MYHLFFSNGYRWCSVRKNTKISLILSWSDIRHWQAMMQAIQNASSMISAPNTSSAVVGEVHVVVKHIRSTTRRKRELLWHERAQLPINANAAVIGCAVVQIILGPVSPILFWCWREVTLDIGMPGCTKTKCVTHDFWTKHFARMNKIYTYVSTH